MKTQVHVDLSSDIIEAIRSLPLEREVEHCGARMLVSPFDFYTTCPRCGAEVKLRSFSGVIEIEDVFDAVLEWISQPGAAQIVRRRQEILAKEIEE